MAKCARSSRHNMATCDALCEDKMKANFVRAFIMDVWVYSPFKKYYTIENRIVSNRLTVFCLQ